MAYGRRIRNTPPNVGEDTKKELADEGIGVPRLQLKYRRKPLKLGNSDRGLMRWLDS
jgi:hypothetical protein